MTRVILLALWQLSLPAAAQFEAGQVSGRGAPPFLLSKTGTRHEDLSSGLPDLSYNVYRRRPGDGFRCISANRVDPAGWPGDAEAPAPGEAWWYTVTADDGWGENRHGSALPIVERCACSGLPAVAGEPALKLRLIASGLIRPTHLAAAPGDRGRLFVVERAGLVRIIERGRLLEAPFLDLGPVVALEYEEGLLSIAFHPAYADNGRFFIAYTAAPEGELLLVEYRVSSDPDRADPASARIVYRAHQPQPVHHGGQLAFGPADGYLYITLGDSSPVCDPLGYGQDLSEPLASILRIDVDGAPPYEIPETNPFASDGDPATLAEVWSYGLRNPWRVSFDPATADLYIADVGQIAGEELNYQSAASPGGENYGWSCVEGAYCNTCELATCACPPDAAWAAPVVTYPHGEGCAVIGGHVYRGCRLPGYSGTYFYSDFCSAFTRSFRIEAGAAVDERDWSAMLPEVDRPASWGVDASGEHYVVNHYAGTIWRLEPAE